MLVIFPFKPKYARIAIRSARLLNQINKIHFADLYIYPSSLITYSCLLLQTTCRMHKATFAALFVSNDLLREFPSSAVANRFELRSHSKQQMLSCYKICSCWPRFCLLCFIRRRIIISL